METSKQLFARREALAAEQESLMQGGSVEDAMRLEGRIQEVDDQLRRALDAEDTMRVEAKAAPKAAKSYGESILGARDEFRGLEIGQVLDSGETPVVWTSGPEEFDPFLPELGASLLSGFAGTLREVAAIGSVNYKQRVLPQSTAPATWAGVTPAVSDTPQYSALKQQVLYEWADAVALKECIAGYVPVSKDALKDYDMMMYIIENDLRDQVAEVEDAKMVAGTNQNGIVGITNTSGIQTFTDGVGGVYFDAIRKMRTLCVQNARRIPTHVAMSPEIKEAIDLYKTTQGFYQSLGEGRYWGMEAVEDANIDGILVYDSASALRRPVHGLSIEVGYYNDQFIKNELSILVEKTTALQVVRPAAFVFAEKDDLDEDPSVSA